MVILHYDRPLKNMITHYFGDIHKTRSKGRQSRVERATRARLVQQNHGESNDKGYLIWEIQDKRCCGKLDMLVLTNPKPFITIELTQKGQYA